MLLMFWGIDSYLPSIYCVSDILINACEYKNGKIGSFPLRQLEMLKQNFDKRWSDCTDGELKYGGEGTIS